MITVIHILGQVIFGGYFIYNGIKHFKDHKDYTAYAASQHVPAAALAIYVTGALLIVGGLGILFWKHVNIALACIALFLIGVTPMMHGFWRHDNPGERASQKIAFLKNMALLGASFIIVQPWM